MQDSPFQPGDEGGNNNNSDGTGSHFSDFKVLAILKVVQARIKTNIIMTIQITLAIMLNLLTDE